VSNSSTRTAVGQASACGKNEQASLQSPSKPLADRACVPYMFLASLREGVTSMAKTPAIGRTQSGSIVGFTANH
jgi:hypothetical protein